MEIHRDNQPSNLRLHLSPHAPLNRSLDADLHPRIPKDDPTSQYAGKQLLPLTNPTN